MPASELQPVLIEDRERVRTITLNKPERLNAFDSEMEARVVDALNEASRSAEIGALVLTGQGRAFCAGHDFREVVSGSDRGRAPVTDGAGQNLMAQAVLRTGKPVIGAINGVVAGGGLALALACDLRIAGEAATFQELHVHRGIVPAMESWLLPRTVGLARAFEMAITGRTVDAATAAEWGIVAEVVSDTELSSHADAAARAAAELPPVAFALTKRAFHLGMQSSLGDTLTYIAAARTIGSQSGESQRGAREFLGGAHDH